MQLAAIWLTGILAGSAGAPVAPSFSGTWERDPERSDDPEEKMRAALEQMRERMERRRGPGGLPPGGPPADRGREGSGGMGRLPEVPEVMELDLEGGELRLDDGHRVQIFYLDGEKHRRELPNGAKLETTAVLQGSSVLIEEKLERGRIDRKLELSSDGETLVLTWTMKMGNMKEPVVIRTLYERMEAGGL